MRATRTLSTFIVSLLLVSAVGCAGTATQSSTGEYIDDTWITTKAKAVLIEDSLVSATEVNVETFKGVVQLSGFVSSDEAMNQAVRLVSDIQGVTEVKNDMRVR
jgi:osmotically-inducible protein OsmY